MLFLRKGVLPWLRQVPAASSPLSLWAIFAGPYLLLHPYLSVPHLWLTFASIAGGAWGLLLSLSLPPPSPVAASALPPFASSRLRGYLPSPHCIFLGVTWAPCGRRFGPPAGSLRTPFGPPSGPPWASLRTPLFLNSEFPTSLPTTTYISPLRVSAPLAWIPCLKGPPTQLHLPPPSPRPPLPCSTPLRPIHYRALNRRPAAYRLKLRA